ncbi:MAG: MotA/TolQ/ExbB proton channel family protein [Cyanobium sp.]
MLHKISINAVVNLAVSASQPLLTTLSGVLLLLLSVAVLTVLIERGRWWWLWWKRQSRRLADWRERLERGAAELPALELSLLDWERDMRWGEPLLQAASILAPLIGLFGTVSGLMHVLRLLGPRLELPAGANLGAYGQVLLTTAVGLLVSLVATAGLLISQSLREWQIGRLRRDLADLSPARR